MFSSEQLREVDSGVQIPPFYIGTRYEASMPCPTKEYVMDPSNPTLSKLTAICSSESVCKFSPYWQLAMVKWPYGLEHAFLVPDPDLFTSGGDLVVWPNNIGVLPDDALQSAFQLLARGAERMFTTFPNINEVYCGFNALHNNSLPFSHFPLFATDTDSWREISPEELARIYPERYRLLTNNDVCEKLDGDLAAQLIEEYEGLFTGKYAVAHSGSCFVPFKAHSIPEVVEYGDFLPMMRWLDENLRTKLNDLPADSRQQCLSVSVSQERDASPELAFQTAVASDPFGLPSGIAETNHRVLAKDRPLMTAGQNAAYQANCKLIADGMWQ